MATDLPNETCESSNPQHDDQALYQDLNQDPRNKTPAQVTTSPPVQNQVRDQGAKGVPHTRFGMGVVLVQVSPQIQMKTHGATPPPPNDNMPANDNVPNKDMGQCQNRYKPHTRHRGFLPEPPPNKTPPPLEMTMHPPMESPKCDPPNETQKRDARRKVQGPWTNHTPAEADFHLSLPPTLTPKSKTCDPAKDSHENRHPQTPKMMPSQYKTVPHTHFGGIQIETPEMMTYPNGEVPSRTPDHTRPSRWYHTRLSSKNKTELPN
ncbi:hypothetical protein BS47DRAFT_1358937 [Hydnum rufescens UP504]|uniref:Uncharacterized protein n=1 Tax=Hydnum rufescens UP504 TaxID=1448309 RepID=A0A9P6B6A7_9AGAM|nr:hypothetical protein BS47DRAFT_1358937 [Hydnum rufescens UP504]